MMQQSAPDRSQPDRTKAYRARIIPTLELHIHAHEKTRDAETRAVGVARRMRHNSAGRAYAWLARSFRSDKDCLLDSTARVISWNPALSIQDAAAQCNGDLSTDRNPKFALLEDLPRYEDVGKQ
jgi:hypothetical protein